MKVTGSVAGPVRRLRRCECQAGVPNADEKAGAEAEPANQPQAIERRGEAPAWCVWIRLGKEN